MTLPIKVLCILGPTATGKTDLALYAAEKYAGEIINVDSAQVYKHMDIGTAKLDMAARQKIPHHLFDIREPFESYSASDFVADASQLIHEIHARGRLPILAGGTMLYFKALFDGLADMPSADETFRQTLEERARTIGWAGIHDELHKVDAISAARINPNDPQRIQRALEVFHLTGKPLSVIHSEQSQQQSAFSFLKIALVPESRSDLHQLIEKRFYHMMEQNFLEEVRLLVERPDFTRTASAMRAVGYRQLITHLLGEESLSEAVEKSIYATRQLAKRQLTWLRKMPGLHVLEPYNPAVKAELDQLYNKSLIHQI